MFIKIFSWQIFRNQLTEVLLASGALKILTFSVKLGREFFERLAASGDTFCIGAVKNIWANFFFVN